MPRKGLEKMEPQISQINADYAKKGRQMSADGRQKPESSAIFGQLTNQLINQLTIPQNSKFAILNSKFAQAFNRELSLVFHLLDSSGPLRHGVGVDT